MKGLFQCPPKLLPLQGDRFASVITQGDALGWELLPFQGVWGKTCETSVISKHTDEIIILQLTVH